MTKEIYENRQNLTAWKMVVPYLKLIPHWLCDNTNYQIRAPKMLKDTL